MKTILPGPLKDRIYNKMRMDDVTQSQRFTDYTEITR